MPKIRLSLLALSLYLFFSLPTVVSAKDVEVGLKFEAQIADRFDNDSFRKQLGEVTAQVSSDYNFKVRFANPSLNTTSGEFSLYTVCPIEYSHCVRFRELLLSVEVPEDFDVKTTPIPFNVTLVRDGSEPGNWVVTNSPAIASGDKSQIGASYATVNIDTQGVQWLVANPDIPVTYTYTPTDTACKVDRQSMNSNETFNFTATGLDTKSQYALLLNTYVYPGTNINITGRYKPDSNGTLVINGIDPQAISSSFSGNLNVWLRKMPGQYICQYLSIKITDITPANVTYYRCDTPHQPCVESVSGGLPNPIGATTNKDSCDKSCLDNGTTFADNAQSKPVAPCANNSCSNAGGIKCPDGSAGFVTAIGCIHTQPKSLVEDVLKFATGIGGGLAFMMMLFGAFQMLTSGGNPQNLQGGRDVFQNALIGLLFIIFSILLMKIIGIDILNIPGFTPNP